MENVLHENLKAPKAILEEICSSQSHTLTYNEAKEALEELIGCASKDHDHFGFELDGAEYRFIGENVIENIFAEEIKQTIEDCYELDSLTDDDKIPSWLAAHISVDWEGVVSACMVDGYGHQFSGYDGSELHVEGVYIFRTN